MNKEDLAINYYHSLTPKDFPVLVRFEIQQAMPPETFLGAVSIHVELRPGLSEDARRLFLSFDGVAKLQLRQEWSELLFPLLEIISIQDHQWEHLNYKVHESEEDTLSFFCKSFKATVKET